jgi:hypothetical protein
MKDVQLCEFIGVVILLKNKKIKKSFCQIGLICFIFKKEKTYFGKKISKPVFLSILKAYL